MNILARPCLALLILVALAVPAVSLAQQDGDHRQFTDGEIRQLLAPIALYPDALLSQVLIAATYPLEVVEAARWSRERGLEGQAAVDAAAGQDWDPSVKSLVAFPDLLARMSEDLDWTGRLGDAFLMQEEAVIAAVQDLRERADAAGSLERLEHARVRRDGDVIVIDPVDPKIVYVPYYSPRIVYGGWGWADWPPYYWYPPSGYYPRTGFWWGGGIVLSGGYFFSGFDWRYRHIVILRHHRHRFHYANTAKWRHDPKHRRGVVYRAPALNRHYRAASTRIERPAERTHEPRRPSALHRSTGATHSSSTGTTYRSGDARRPALGRAGPTRDVRERATVTAPRRETAGTRSTRESRGRDRSPLQQRGGISAQQRPAFRSGSAGDARGFGDRPRPAASGSRPSALNRGMR